MFWCGKGIFIRLSVFVNLLLLSSNAESYKLARATQHAGKLTATLQNDCFHSASENVGGGYKKLSLLQVKHVNPATFYDTHNDKDLYEENDSEQFDDDDDNNENSGADADYDDDDDYEEFLTEKELQKLIQNDKLNTVQQKDVRNANIAVALPDEQHIDGSAADFILIGNDNKNTAANYDDDDDDDDEERSKKRPWRKVKRILRRQLIKKPKRYIRKALHKVGLKRQLRSSAMFAGKKTANTYFAILPEKKTTTNPVVQEVSILMHDEKTLRSHKKPQHSSTKKHISDLILL